MFLTSYTILTLSILKSLVNIEPYGKTETFNFWFYFKIVYFAEVDDLPTNYGQQLFGYVFKLFFGLVDGLVDGLVADLVAGLVDGLVAGFVDV